MSGDAGLKRGRGVARRVRFEERGGAGNERRRRRVVSPPRAHTSDHGESLHSFALCSLYAWYCSCAAPARRRSFLVRFTCFLFPYPCPSSRLQSRPAKKDARQGLTDEEIEEIREAFNLFDTDGNGEAGSWCRMVARGAARGRQRAALGHAPAHVASSG